jgi:hypothetical protein
MSENLSTYLKDHYAGSTFGADLARRLAEENEGDPKLCLGWPGGGRVRAGE